jgi:hypothetical protein
MVMVNFASPHTFVISQITPLVYAKAESYQDLRLLSPYILIGEHMYILHLRRSFGGCAMVMMTIS